MPPATATIDYWTLAELRYHIRRFLRIREVAARAQGVEPQQYLLLLQVKGLQGRRAATIGALAERLQVTHHSAVELVDRLVRRGMLMRRALSRDRRAVAVTLTAKGARVVQSLARRSLLELQTEGPALLAVLRRLIGTRGARTEHPTVGGGRARRQRPQGDHEMTITRGSVLMVAILITAALGLGGCPKRPGSAVGAAPAPSGTAAGAASGSSMAAGSGSQSATSSPGGSGAAKSAAAMQPSEFAAVGSLKDIRFDFDRYDIRPDDAKTLDANAKWLKTNAGVQVLIEGHCDERGTLEYNLALGDRRAKAAMAYLMNQGVGGARIAVISYGEERPLCAGHDEACWVTNRRDHFLGGGK